VPEPAIRPVSRRVPAPAGKDVVAVSPVFFEIFEDAAEVFAPRHDARPHEMIPEFAQARAFCVRRSRSPLFCAGHNARDKPRRLPEKSP